MALGEDAPISSAGDAALLLRLYERVGVDCLGLLAGSFSFCLYDEHQARVLAARDPSGEVPLVTARTAEGSLLLACGEYMPATMERLEEVQPGEWRVPVACAPDGGPQRRLPAWIACLYGVAAFLPAAPVLALPQ
jgi:asparagine synthetase B (glutamine-hydrolysing)